MSRVDIIYFYEHVARELDVACVVKCLVEERYGLTMRIVQHPFGQLMVGADLGRIQPKVVALPHAYLSGIYTPYLLDWPRAIYVNLMWEQLFYDANRGTKIPRGVFSVRHVLHHVWGEFAKHYLENVGVPEAHIIVNGHPAYALYGEPYCRYYPSRDELARKHNLNSGRRWVFFPENYNWAFYNETTLRGAQGKNTWVADQIFPLRDFCRSSLEEVIRWCSAIAASNEVEFIIRPRPAVPMDDFVAVARNAEPNIPVNVHFLKDESVREWILASDVIVSSYSTSLIEAAVAGKPVCMVEPYPIPKAVYAAWHDLLPHARTIDEFKNFCLKYAGYEGRLGAWARGLLMAHGDPIAGLADLLAKMATGEILPPPRLAFKDIPLPPAFDKPRRLAYAYHWARRQYQHLAVRVAKRSVIPDAKFETDLVSFDDIARRKETWGRILKHPTSPLPRLYPQMMEAKTM